MWSKASPPTIEGEHVRLRPLTAHDLPMTLAWRNQDSIRDKFFHAEVITPEQHQAWFKAYQHKDTDFVFVIDEKGPPARSVGQVALYNIDWSARRAEFGRLMIGEAEARDKGLAKAAIHLLVAAAEDQLQLVEIYLEVYRDNLPAISVYRACGFVEAGHHDRVLKMVRPWQ